MKKFFVVLAVVAIVALVAAGAAMAGVSGSKHDFSADWTAGLPAGNLETCVHCHTPHGGDTTALGRDTSINSGNILWNRDIITGAATIGGNRGSNTCMSCHDGSVGTTMKNAPGSGGKDQAVALCLGRCPSWRI